MEIQLSEQIGRGANGTVWRGTDELERDLAIKFIDYTAGEVLNSVRNHAHALAQINHTNVVRIFCVENIINPETPDDPPVPALVMEYVSGESFEDWLGRSGKSKSEIQRVLMGLVDGIEAFHNVDLAHQDLHARNIRVSAGVAKIIDPMAFDPATVLTTALTHEKRLKDLRDLRYLCQQALCGISGNLTQIGNFAMQYTNATTLNTLRENLRMAIQGSNSDASAVFDVYAHCRQAQEHGNLVQWQEARKAAIRMLQPELEQWRSENTTNLPTSNDELARHLFGCLNSIEPILSLLLSSAEHGDGDTGFSNELDLLNRVLTVDWPRSGPDDFVEIPSLLAYLSQYLTGATLFLNRHYSLVVRLVNYNLLEPSIESSSPLWKTHEITGWPQTIRAGCVDAYNILREAYRYVPIVRRVFPSVMDYRTSLAGYNCLLSVRDFISRGNESLLHNRTTDVGARMERFHVPPMYLTSDRNELLTMWTNLNSTIQLSKYYIDYSELSPDEFVNCWPIWLEESSKFLHSCRVKFVRIPEFLSQIRG